eukprot:scpid109042/ scgid10370/ 
MLFWTSCSFSGHLVLVFLSFLFDLFAFTLIDCWKKVLERCPLRFEKNFVSVETPSSPMQESPKSYDVGRQRCHAHSYLSNLKVLVDLSPLLCEKSLFACALNGCSHAYDVVAEV